MVLLCGCPTVDLGDNPPDIGLCNPLKGFPYFQNEIVPKYLKLSDAANGCGRDGGCHNRAHGLAFDLTPANLAGASNYRVAQQYLDCGAWRQSPLLTKPLAGEDGHGGGDLIQDGSAEMAVFKGWFE
ncbi:MAG TPA: hypothetical protein VIV40_21935 [Kofleriaceae bacterium]